ncbi:MAG: hypothetical protein ACFE95_00155 [Candidatus Hodarchaeota archaeon]
MKYYGLYNILAWDDMIKLIEEAEGDPTKKKELLTEINLQREKEEKQKQEINDLSTKDALLEKKARTIENTPQTFKWIEYEDYDERVRIFKKRLAIFLTSENNNK